MHRAPLPVSVGGHHGLQHPLHSRLIRTGCQGWLAWRASRSRTKLLNQDATNKPRYARGETLPPFATSFTASLSIEARPERLTGDAGAVLVREVIERTGIIAWMTARLHGPRQPHLVTYPLAELLRTMLVLFAQGWRDQDDADGLRLDPALRCAVAGARHHAAGGGGAARLAAHTLPAARPPDPRGQPARAARGAGRTRRPAPARRARWPAPARRARWPAPAPSDHRRRRT